MTHNKGKFILRFATLVALLVALGLTPSLGTAATQEPKMYWTDSDAGKIQRANLDGTGVEDLVTGLNSPRGIALDVAGGKMYWTSSMAPAKSVNSFDAGKIQRANLDGTGVQDLVTGLSLPGHIALDTAAGKMYWTESGGFFAPSKSVTGIVGRIRRANLDGTGVEDLVTGLNGPYGIALDLAAGKMYWTERGTTVLKSVNDDACTGDIKRANLNGSNVEDLWTELCGPGGIDLDVDGGKMYWTESGWITATGLANDDEAGKIRRANLDGTGDIEDLVTELDGPLDIALDVMEGMMYWTDTGTHPNTKPATASSNGKILAAKLNGTGVAVLVTGLAWPFGLALYLPATLTVNKDGVGTVISDPAGINCGADCTETHEKGTTVVTLTAHPGVKSYFVGWSGNCAGTERTAQVTMDADKTCIATFGYPVGGIVVPVNRLGLLVPWMGLAALAGLAGLGVALVRRRGS